MKPPFRHFRYFLCKIKKQIPKRHMVHLMIILSIITMLFNQYSCDFCRTLNSNLNAITSQKISFSGYTKVYTNRVVSGPVSNNLYFLDKIYLTTNFNTAIRKASIDGTPIWMTAIMFEPIMKSLSIDATEMYIYFASYDTITMDVVRITADFGSIVDAQKFSNLIGASWDIKIHLISDGSGYYITGRDSTAVASICKYLFSTPSTSQCQLIPNFKDYAFGQLKLSDESFYMLGYHSSTTSLHLYKLTFGNLSADWALKMICTSSPCSAFQSESASLFSSIYSFFTFGSTKYLYLAVISQENGYVSIRYKSSITCDRAYGLAVSGNFILASVCYNNLLIFNTVDNSFIIKSLSFNIYGQTIETATGRIVIGGFKDPYGYTKIFYNMKFLKK